MSLLDSILVTLAFSVWFLLVYRKIGEVRNELKGMIAEVHDQGRRSLVGIMGAISALNDDFTDAGDNDPIPVALAFSGGAVYTQAIDFDFLPSIGERLRVLGVSDSDECGDYLDIPVSDVVHCVDGGFLIVCRAGHSDIAYREDLLSGGWVHVGGFRGEEVDDVLPMPGGCGGDGQGPCAPGSPGD